MLRKVEAKSFETLDRFLFITFGEIWCISIMHSDLWVFLTLSIIKCQHFYFLVSKQHWF